MTGDDARRRRRHRMRRARNRVAEILLPYIIRLWCSTLRIRWHNMASFPLSPRGRGPLLYAFWHERLLLFAYTHRGHGVTTLISQHADGELIARVVERLGLAAVRGSATRGGTAAVLGMIRRARAGWDLAVTPDGPRGPRRNFREGAIALAAAAGIPLLLGTNAYSASWELPTWDRMRVPKPFARALVRAGPVIRIAPGAGEEEVERLRVDAERMLRSLTDETDREFDRLWREASPFRASCGPGLRAWGRRSSSPPSSPSRSAPRPCG
ncbi:MAG: DUF374 domain-containing protein [Planctomycetes bacterium]|nr:DUF374 domain-containing protein [Planctomycetota bacterium]